MIKLIERAYRWMEANPVTVMLVSLGLGAFATVAVVGVAIRGEDTRAIITRSACAIAPDGAACQRIKRESDRHQSRADACIPFERVDRDGRLLRLTLCEQHSPRRGRRASRPTSGAGGARRTGSLAPSGNGEPRKSPPVEAHAPEQVSGHEPAGKPRHPTPAPASPPRTPPPPVTPAEPSPAPSEGASGSIAPAPTQPQPVSPAPPPSPSPPLDLAPTVGAAGTALSEVLCVVRDLVAPCP